MATGIRGLPELGLNSGTTLAPLPAPPADATVTLELRPSSGSPLMPVAIALDSYQFGFENVVSFSGAGAGAGSASFDQLQVRTPVGNSFPDLFKALVTGSPYATAVLTQKD